VDTSHTGAGIKDAPIVMAAVMHTSAMENLLARMPSPVLAGPPAGPGLLLQPEGTSGTVRMTPTAARVRPRNQLVAKVARLTHYRFHKPV